MKKAVKQNPNAVSTSREKMFRMAATVRALRVPASDIQKNSELKVYKV